jgi:maleylacetoacetate isomerase
MKLYHYFRSSASFRVRIALALKGLSAQTQGVHLAKGEHLKPAYAQLVADPLVPMLELPDGQRLTQSVAILEYLDEVHPQPPLLPSDPVGRARVRAMALTVACEIHPLNNLRVLSYLLQDLGLSEDQKQRWYAHWVRLGLEAFETQLADPATGVYCHGDTPGLADCLLVPQVVNAQRFNVPLSGLPRVQRVFDACMALPAFSDSHPSQCPDRDA